MFLLKHKYFCGIQTAVKLCGIERGWDCKHAFSKSNHFFCVTYRPTSFGQTPIVDADSKKSNVFGIFFL